jgi:tetratricopeptide (TPR) repeat protein
VAVFAAVTIPILQFVVFPRPGGVADAEELLKKREYREAYHLVENAIEEDGPRHGLLVQKAKILIALAWERQNREGWRNYGTNLDDWLDTDEADKAEDVLRSVLADDPDNIDAHYFLGMLYMEKGWAAKAESEFLDVLRHDREHISARVNLAAVYTMMDRPTFAEDELRRAYRLAPDTVRVVKNLAFLYRFYLDKPESAMVWSNRYLNMAPKGDRDVNIVRAELKEMLQRYPDFALREPQTWRKQRRFAGSGRERSEPVPDR